MTQAEGKGGQTSTADCWRNAEEFKQCAKIWADRIRVTPARIQLQTMTKKWASCSPGGVVSFNKRLLHEDRSFGEQVIVHELIHLKVPNHGPVFRSLFRAYMPDPEANIVLSSGAVD